MNKINSFGYECFILNKREIEFYYPLSVHIAAQQGDAQKEAQTKEIYNGDQGTKYRDATNAYSVCVPAGKYLRKLLAEYLTDKNQLDHQIREIIEHKIIPWKKEILGEV